MVSAETYFDVDPETLRGRLYRATQVAGDDHSVAGGVAIAVFATLTCYATMDKNAFPDRLGEWEAEFGQIMLDVKRAKD